MKNVIGMLDPNVMFKGLGSLEYVYMYTQYILFSFVMNCLLNFYTNKKHLLPSTYIRYIFLLQITNLKTRF